MKKIYIRLLELVEALENSSQTAFAKKVGLNQSTFWGYLNEQGQSKIRLEVIEKILSTYPHVSRNWLYFGEGEMLQSDNAVAQEESKGNAVKKLEIELSKCKDENLRLAKELIEAKEEALELYRTLHAKESS